MYYRLKALPIHFNFLKLLVCPLLELHSPAVRQSPGALLIAPGNCSRKLSGCAETRVPKGIGRARWSPQVDTPILVWSLRTIIIPENETEMNDSLPFPWAQIEMPGQSLTGWNRGNAPWVLLGWRPGLPVWVRSLQCAGERQPSPGRQLRDPGSSGSYWVFE